jgi:putative inorganic carbon (HCO3(-)) transporter
MTRWSQFARRLQEGSLYVLLALLPFSKAACEITFGLLLVGWLMERLHPATRTQTVWLTERLRPLALAAGAYLLVCALSILVSDFPQKSLEGFVEKWLEYVLFLVIVTDLAARPQGEGPRIVRRGLIIMAVSASCILLQGVAQEIFIARRRFGYDATFMYHRMLGPYENPIDLATYLIVLIPVLVGLSMTCQGLKRAALWMLLVGLLACVARLESFGAWLGLWAGLLITASDNRQLRWSGLALLLVSVVGGWTFLQHTGHVDKLSSLSSVGRVDRWMMWQAALGMIRDQPLLGHGVNTFMANYLAYWVGGEQVPRYAHNCFLQVAAETGVAGLVAFLWLLGGMLSRWWRAVRARELQRDHRVLLLGLSAGLVAFLVQSSVDTNFYSLRQATLFWTLAGLATGLALATERAGCSPECSAHPASPAAGG